MSEVSIDLLPVLELAQQMTSTFEYKEGITTTTPTFHDPKDYNMNGLTSLVSDPVAANVGVAKLAAVLDRAAKKASESKSLSKYKFDDQIESLAYRVRKRNEKMMKIARLLTWMVDRYETNEAALVSRLGAFGMISQDAKTWLPVYSVPIGTRGESTWGGLVGMISGDADFASPILWGEADKYGINGTIFTTSHTVTERGSSGERVVVTEKMGLGTVSGVVGGDSIRFINGILTVVTKGRIPYKAPAVPEDGTRSFGFDASITAVSTERTSNGITMSTGVGPGYTFLVTDNPDGSKDANTSIFGSPVSVGASKQPNSVSSSSGKSQAKSKGKSQAKSGGKPQAKSTGKSSTAKK